MALFGLTAIADGVAGLLAGVGGIGNYGPIACDLAVLGSLVADIARGESFGVDSTLIRVATVAGALLYAVLTIGRHVL